MAEITETNILEIKLLELIKEYVDCSRYVCDLLRKEIKSGSSFLRAKVQKELPKEGFLDTSVYYKFHGAGCFFELSDLQIQIDIDFGPNDRCDGFDLFRIRDFYENFPTKYPELSAEGNIEYGFSILKQKGIIFNPKWAPNDHLFYLK